jgi:hypothetical protein
VTERADIVDTNQPYVRAARITINAPAQVIFDVIANPRRHADFDGSGTVKGTVSGPQRLSLGATFGMSMNMGFPYTTRNTVVEFDEGRRIGWRHIGRHTWRYELEPVDANTTVVTETFDGSTAWFPPALKLIKAYDNNQKAVAKSVANLKALIEQENTEKGSSA